MNTNQNRRTVLAVMASVLGIASHTAGTAKEITATDMPDVNFHVPKVTLSGMEIAHVRKQAARANLGSYKRRRSPIAHVGKKQLTKITMRAPFNAATIG